MINLAFYNAWAALGSLKGFVMLILDVFVNVLLFVLLIFIVYFAWQYFEYRYSSNNKNNNDDIFFDNAPLPKSPSPLPPSQNAETFEQMQFQAFMKKYKEEKEKEKIEILRK